MVPRQMDVPAHHPGPTVWWEAARPRTLPASVAPVLVGTAASLRAVGDVAAAGSTARVDADPGILVGRFLLAMVVALALQVAVNYANDYFDGVAGVDTADRVGPRRAVATGMVRPARMRAAMLAALAVAGLAGLALAALAGWELLLVGLAALVAAVGYSGGPRPYASAGLGELFVFVFFGVVATAGSAYVQDERLTALALVASVPMGLLATALLVVNNLRDIPTDRAVGKVTLAVRLGEAGSRRLYLALVGLAYAVPVAMIAVTGHGWYGLPVLSLPLAWRGVEQVRHAPLGPRLVEALGHTARAQLAFAVLFTLALLLRRDTLAGLL
jgi:1,4-dihydroxy-2-naphthoate octaprenyltransferase